MLAGRLCMELSLFRVLWTCVAAVARPQSSCLSPCHAGGASDEDKQRLAVQLVQLDEAYPGGLLQYIRNARRLLQDSREGALRKQAALY